MSTSIVVLLPMLLLGIVGLFCFVGCVLQTGGLGGDEPPPFSTYTGARTTEKGILAYWPLGEAKLTDAAAELIHNKVGTYTDMSVKPAFYPWPAFTIPNAPDPDIHSDAAPGKISLGQPGLVKGDAVQPANNPADITTCVVVNGCYVDVPFAMEFTPQGSFTVEAWVRPDWTNGDTDAWRFVVDGRDSMPGRGFAIFAKTDDTQMGVYHWAGVVGNGGVGNAGFTIVTQAMPIALGTPDPVYLALTYDASNPMLTLFVNGSSKTSTAVVPAYVPNTTQPLWIGAGTPYLPARPQPDGTPSSPGFPFVGAIQDVAIYDRVLSDADILRHFNNGNGTDPG
jgi:Concanavalin A-like lectin/glucanases superfamily